MPFGKVKGQILWPNFTFSQTSSDLCTGYVDFAITSPNPVLNTFNYLYKVNNVAVGEYGDQFSFSPNQNGSVITYNITCVIDNGNGYTTTHGPFYVSSIAGLYIKKDATIINSCLGNPTLDASINGAVLANSYTGNILWYLYDPSTHISTQVGSQTQYLNLSGLSNGTHYYYYTNSANGCTVQSGMYQVYVIKSITITANNANLEPGTVLTLSSANITTPPLYLSLQWYRNGVMIPGATTTSYTANWPGTYYLGEPNPGNCAGMLSNSIVITCDPIGIVIKSNYTFQTGTTNLSGYLKFDGTVTIPAGAVVNINNAKVHMTSCAEIIVDNNSNLNQTGGRLNISNSTISGCAAWQWIKIIGNSGIGNPVQNGLLSLSSTEVRDASMAIYTLNGGTVNISSSILENNKSHMAIVNCPNVTSSIANTTLSYLNAGATCNIGNIYPLVNGINGGTTKMVYLYNSSGITFSNSTFELKELKTIMGGALSSTPNAIETYNCNKSVNANYSFNLQSCVFKGNFFQMVYSSLCEMPLINGTTNMNYNIEGNFTNVFVFDRCTKPSITDQKMHPGSSGQTYYRGILSYQSDGLYFYNNIVDGFDRGLEFYQQIASSNKTTIGHNAFINNDYGVVIAPEVFPVGNNGNPNPNYNYYNNQRNVLLNCNKFYDCNWGVVGVGNIITQSTLNNNNNDDWDCFFTSNAGGNNYSKKADVAWYDYDNINNAVRQIEIYYDQTNYPLTFSAQSINLDGNTASKNNYCNTYIDQRQATGQGCRGSFKTDPVPPKMNKADSIINEVTIYPNPFSGRFTISSTLSTATNYILYDITGKVIYQGIINGSGEFQIDATMLPLGCYLLKLTDAVTGKSIQSNKLVKINE